MATIPPVYRKNTLLSALQNRIFGEHGRERAALADFPKRFASAGAEGKSDLFGIPVLKQYFCFPLYRIFARDTIPYFDFLEP